MLSLIMLDDVDDDDNVYNADTSFKVSNFTPARSKAPCSKATGACGGISSVRAGQGQVCPRASAPGAPLPYKEPPAAQA